MYVVALTRWGKPLEDELPHLAQALGEQAYDLRLALAGVPPVYVYRGPDLARTQDALLLLQRRGHGAVACELSSVVASSSMLAPRGVTFDGDQVRVSHGVTTESVAYSDLLALIHAMEAVEVDSLEKTTTREFSLGRAALSGGLLWSKKKTGEKHEQAREAEPVAYLFRHNGAPILLRQGSIRLEGEGIAVPRTSVEAFQLCIQELRRRAPQAHYDNRLLTSKRKAKLASHRATSTSVTTSHSNASENDLAAHVIALASLKQQL